MRQGGPTLTRQYGAVADHSRQEMERQVKAMATPSNLLVGVLLALAFAVVGKFLRD